MKLRATGQTHLFGKILLNVQVNYLPGDYLTYCLDQNNKCPKILEAHIIDGFRSNTSTKIKFIPGSSFSFSIEIDFEVEPIGIFTLEVGFDQGWQNKYFKGLDISSTIEIEVNPSLLSLYVPPNTLANDELVWNENLPWSFISLEYWLLNLCVLISIKSMLKNQFI